MKNRICYIIAAGEQWGEFTPDDGDFVIAADGGCGFAETMGVTPDLAVGDFDSWGSPPDNCPVLRVNAEKDVTDTALAVSEGLARGYRSFVIYGGMGGRIDHTLANIQLICGLSAMRCRASLIGRGVRVTAVTDSSLILPLREKGTVSVFCHSDTAEGVNITGLKYELREHTLNNVTPLGISNEFKGRAAKITVRKGTLAVMWEE